MPVPCAGRGPVTAIEAQPVEAQAADHHDQPAPHVVYLVDTDPQQTGEGFLHDIFGLAQPAHHAKRDVEHVAAVLTPDQADIGVSGISWELVVHAFASEQPASTATPAHCHTIDRPSVPYTR